MSRPCGSTRDGCSTARMVSSQRPSANMISAVARRDLYRLSTVFESWVSTVRPSRAFSLRQRRAGYQAKALIFPEIPLVSSRSSWHRSNSVHVLLHVAVRSSCLTESEEAGVDPYRRVRAAHPSSTHLSMRRGVKGLTRLAFLVKREPLRTDTIWRVSDCRFRTPARPAGV
jgi:hypothetical protein